MAQTVGMRRSRVTLVSQLAGFGRGPVAGARAPRPVFATSGASLRTAPRFPSTAANRAWCAARRDIAHIRGSLGRDRPAATKAVIRLRTAPSCVGSKLTSLRAAAARSSGAAFSSISWASSFSRTARKRSSNRTRSLANQWSKAGEIPSKIIEKPLGMIGARERVDPAGRGVEPHRLASDLDQTGNPTVDDVIQLRQGMTQAHPGLRITGAIPKSPARRAREIRSPWARHRHASNARALLARGKMSSPPGAEARIVPRRWIVNVLLGRSYGVQWRQ